MDAKLRVLYAEDNRQDVDLTTSFFAQHVPDIALEIVHTAAECLARLQVQRFDALLLDHRLPDMDGGDLLKELANRKLPVPVVMVTGAGDEELVVKLLRLGALDYVPKRGTYLETLPDVLRTTISQHRRLQQTGLRVGPRHRRALYVEKNEADIDLTLRHFAESARHW